MILKFEVDTDDLYNDGEMDFESLLTDRLRDAVMKDCKDKLSSDRFDQFAALTADTIVAGVKLRMENFLSEEISINDRWGKAEFVGSLEDLIKKNFDDVLLRPVDGNGKTLQGCTSSGWSAEIMWNREK